ncbi:MAG: YegP family protein [Halobacterium sp.]
MSQTFELYEDSAGEWRWRLHTGGDVVADSGEGYSSRQNAEDAIDRVRRDAGGADVLEYGTPHFEVYEDAAGEWRWRFVAANGRIVADSGEGYASKSGVRDALDAVKKNAYDADVETE